MNRNRILMFIAALFIGVVTGAQTKLPVREVRMDSTMLILSNMTVDDYINLHLPPLDSLYYNAYCMSNAIKYYDEEAKYYASAVTTEKLKPLDWIRLVSSANYGNTDIASTLRSEATYPIWVENSSKQRNFFFNVGVTLNIPLSDVFNTHNKVRQAQAKLRQTQHRRDAELDNIKQQIISLYCEVISGINSLKSAAERMVIAKAQYEFAEKDFINNKITSEVLYRCKSYETAATQDYERMRSGINQALLSLEVVSCTKLISPEKETEPEDQAGKHKKKK